MLSSTCKLLYKNATYALIVQVCSQGITTSYETHLHRSETQQPALLLPFNESEPETVPSSTASLTQCWSSASSVTLYQSAPVV